MEFIHGSSSLGRWNIPSTHALTLFARKRLAQVPRLDRQLERTERLMRYEFRIQRMNSVITPGEADESGTA
jgi:hypothetical protein